MSDSSSSDNIEHKAYKALPRDENQEIHKKPRIFIHRPTEGDAEATEQARQQASILEAARTIQAEDFTKVHEKPCVRNALLPAIGGGTFIGAGRLVFGGKHNQRISLLVLSDVLIKTHRLHSYGL